MHHAEVVRTRSTRDMDPTLWQQRFPPARSEIGPGFREEFQALGVAGHLFELGRHVLVDRVTGPDDVCFRRSIRIRISISSSRDK